MSQPALFLDRDGVINVDHGYVHKPEEVAFVDGIFELIAAAKRAGYLVVVVTNQAGIGRGYYGEDDFHALMDWIKARFAERGGQLDAVYFCPYHPEHGIGEYRRESDCRKPAPGMLLQAARDLDIDLTGSIFVGDMPSDMAAGRAAGVGTLLQLGAEESDTADAHAGTPIQRLQEAILYLHRISAPVSVIIVNWNAGDLLERCVSSLLAQTVLPHEIIVVDNASTDGSIKRIVDQFPSVRVIESTRNLGFAAANNLAVQEASSASDWFVFLNPDAFPEPGWLRALLSAATGHPECVVFGSRLMDANSPGVVDGVGDVYHASGLVWRAGHGALLGSHESVAREIFSPCAAAAMFRKDALLAAGGFDEDFFCYVEDVDLGFRLRLLGHRCWYVPDSVALHVGSAVTGRHSDFSVYHGHRNLVWAFVKNMPGVLFWLLLPLHVMLNLVSVVWFALRGQGAVILRANRDALLGLPKMWRKRQQVQKTRVASIRDVWQVLDKRLLPIRRKT